MCPYTFIVEQFVLRRSTEQKTGLSPITHLGGFVDFTDTAEVDGKASGVGSVIVTLDVLKLISTKSQADISNHEI
jgi:hypothetical protein